MAQSQIFTVKILYPHHSREPDSVILLPYCILNKAHAQSTLNPEIIKCRCNLWAISNLTLFSEAALPSIFNVIVGCKPPSPVIDATSIVPPATCKNGLTESNTTFTWSSSKSGVSGRAWMTS
mmetsp:Transcript_32661/g.65005  ORF Transcript_32661/g.65005 Transcript_32661/m.65005 type:complete len:122 (-) Transcript_32661:633-998(-)